MKMVSEAAKAVLTVMIFTNHKLASGFVAFSTNSSIPNLESIYAYQQSYFARFASNDSGPHSYVDDYPATGTNEFMSSRPAESDANGNTPNGLVKADFNEPINTVEYSATGINEAEYISNTLDKLVNIDSNGSYVRQGKESITRAVKDEIEDGEELNYSDCLIDGTLDGRQPCEARFDWKDGITFGNGTGGSVTNLRSKRSLYHSCCVSSAHWVSYSSFPDLDGINRTLAHVDGSFQYFAKDTCVPDQSCTQCQKCECRLDYIYQHAIYTEGKDHLGRDILQLGVFKFPHICRCIRM